MDIYFQQLYNYHKDSYTVPGTVCKLGVTIANICYMLELIAQYKL